ncbi:DUF423 domain-containing protein [Eisenibacter elegans]|jgi:uncharacterized membrane protein YgdD (TMEM256/DUF423 family)|uniref:DUF423 domain-containing protein n=1 Tax=Eisenibacter elegans TaxID=997 RepID=UPI0004164289|nr:DUF423 domain-containing protein [Eisenibacter elegans]
MAKIFLLLGALLGGLAVGLGAFGAHALKAMLSANQRLDTFELAVKYQFYHALALLITGILLWQTAAKAFVYAGYAFTVGVLIFSGSLYILSLSNVGKWGAVTPIGGVGLILGWAFLLWGIASQPWK